MPRQSIPALLDDQHLDAVVASSVENVFFLSGTLILTQRIIPSRMALVVWARGADPTLIVCGIEEQQVRRESWIADVRTYAEFRDAPMRLAADVLAERGLRQARIGVEMASLPIRYARELEECLPAAELVDAERVFDCARMVKSPAELEVLAGAARATDTAIHATFEGAHLGDTEAQLVERMTRRLVAEGGDGTAFVVLTTGANSKLVHPVASATPVAAGDVVRTDFGGFFGAYFGGYYSDLARTAVAGTPTERQRSIYARLYEVHRELLAAVKPGVRACDLFDQCRAGFQQRGLNFRLSHIGHGIGIGLHEYPMLNPATSQALEPGMVLAIEPLHFDDEGLYHIEDMLEVTADGARLLSSPDRWSELRAIG